MQAQSLFVTGTDTDAGKTYVSQALLQGLKALGQSVVGLKPLAAGIDSSGFNPDALVLQQASSIALDYKMVNPMLWQRATAPHLAAAELDQKISLATLDQWADSTAQCPVQWRLIEGAGGWLLPIGPKQYLADWVMAQQWPVLLVVGVRLGCLNHSMLTLRELQRSGVPVLGWVANILDPAMDLLRETIADLQQRIEAPCLAVLPHSPQVSTQHAAALAQALMKSANELKLA